MRYLRTVLLPPLLLLISGGLALAATGLTVGPAGIAAEQPMAAGQRYTLPAYTVTNGSSQEMRVTISPSDHRDAERDLAPDDWFQVQPQSLTIPPGSSRQVQVVAVLPPDAAPGAYKRWFRFHAEPVRPSGLGGATAVEVSFTFDVAEPASRQPAGFLRDNWLPGLIALGLLTFLLIRLRTPKGGGQHSP